MYWNNERDRQKIQDLLNRDEIIVCSTDTVLGLLGRLTQQSYDSINRIKQRSDKPYLIMIESKKALPRFVAGEIHSNIIKLIDASWPGPVTLIFKARSDLPDFIKSHDGRIALRVPSHAGLVSLLQHYDGLFSTSANIHTEPIPYLLSDVNPKIAGLIAGSCLDQEDILGELLPSTILDCSEEKVRIVRMGQGLSDEIQELIKR